jgi:dipeptidyl-peptidase 4
MVRKIVILFLTVIYIETYAQPTLSDFVSSNTYTQKTFGNIYPSPDGEHFFHLKDNLVLRYSFSNGEIDDTLINTLGSSFVNISEIDDYWFSDNAQTFLFSTATKPLYRYSFYAKYYTYNILSGKLTEIADTQMIRGTCLSPNGLMVAYVFQNNVYIKYLNIGVVKQVTYDGKSNNILNGATDWANEEEFTIKQGLYWSPDSKYLAFYKFDESEVREYPLTMYKTDGYPLITTYKYPRAGEKISKTKVFVLDLSTNNLVQINTNVSGDYYLPRICWSKTNNKLAIARINRAQNKLELLLASAQDGSASVVYTEITEKYIDEPDENFITFINSKNDFLILSEKSGFKHIWYHSIDGKIFKQLTKGNWEVKSFYGYDQKTNSIYYTSNEISPIQENVYSMSLDNNMIKRLSKSDGTNKPVFSSNFRYFINTHFSYTEVASELIYNSNGDLIKVITYNDDLQQKVIHDSIPIKEPFSFITDSGVTLYGWMIKPTGFDVSKKYPVLFYVYGGPGVQTVIDQYDIRWYNYLATKGYLIVSVDNRGSGGRGVDFRTTTFRNFGDIEVKDQVAAAKYITGLGYVDTSRIGIFGWSFGGYLSAMSLLKGEKVFKLAVSVAPPTDWHFYDAIYTERYMGLPDENVLGYLRSSLVQNVFLLSGKLLLIHGTADENVQVQNTLLFSEALVRANKQFEMQLYTDRNHKITGGNTSIQLYTKICDYLIKNL